MKIHPGVKPAAWGAAAGAVAIMTLGFWQFGWTLGSTAEKMANQRAETAVVSAMIPLCVANFQQQPDAAARLIALKKASSWDQRSLVEKGGWATMPGTSSPNLELAAACAEKLGRLS